MNGKICSAAEAMADVHDGDLVAAHYWGPCGSPSYLFRALIERGVKELTFYINNFVSIPPVVRDMGYPDPTILLPQLKKIITPFIGGRVYGGLGGDFLGDLVKSGQLEIEATTHGVYVERLHAGAMRSGGFYSPIGLDTIVEKGKERRVIDGKEYILQKPVCPDVGLIKADRADTLGNLVYRGTARGANPIIAMASKLTIVEVFDIVEPGELDPETVVTPGIYVDRIVKIPEDDIASDKRRREVFEWIAGRQRAAQAASGSAEGGQE